MKQYTYEVLNSNQLDELLQEASDYLIANPASAVLAQIFAGYNDRERLAFGVGHDEFRTGSDVAFEALHRARKDPRMAAEQRLFAPRLQDQTR